MSEQSQPRLMPYMLQVDFRHVSRRDGPDKAEL
jgi:hypothetical protein